MPRCGREYKKIAPNFKECINSKKSQHCSRRQCKVLFEMTIM